MDVAEFRPMPKAKRPKTKARKPLPNFIRQWRKFRGLTLEQLSGEVGLNFSTISQIERCESGYSWESLEDIAAALECTPADLLSGPPDATDEELLSEWRAIPQQDRGRAMRMLRLLNGRED